MLKTDEAHRSDQVRSSQVSQTSQIITMLRILKPRRLAGVRFSHRTAKFPFSGYDEYPNNYLTAIASSSDAEIDQLLGPKVLRATKVEAAVRMLADYFLVYDAMDKTFLEEKLKREVDAVDAVDANPSSSTPSPISVNHSLMTQMNNDELLQAHKFALKQFSVPAMGNINDYIEMTAYNTPNYTVSNSKKAYTDLFTALSRFKPGFLTGLSYELLYSNGLPNLEAFHLIIRQLTSYGYCKPAQLALDCLYSSGIPLTLETLSLEISLAVADGDLHKFMTLAGCIQPGAHYRKRRYNERYREIVNGGIERVLKNMSQSKELPQWPKKSNIPITNYIRTNALNDEDIHNLAPVFTNIAEGFFVFKKYDLISLVILEMFALRVLNRRVLSLNLRAADATKDKVRAEWTINEMISNETLFYAKNEKYIGMAKRTAKNLGLDELRDRLETYNQKLEVKTV